MGGVGKTELALQYARRYAMNRTDVTVERLPVERLPVDFFARKGENSKPLSLQERGLERGFLDPVKKRHKYQILLLRTPINQHFTPIAV